MELLIRNCMNRKIFYGKVLKKVIAEGTNKSLNHLYEVIKL